jgi:hemolysin III
MKTFSARALDRRWDNMIDSAGGVPEYAWNYDRVELVADAIVHVIGVGLGLIGAVVIVVITANSEHAADTGLIVIYSISLLSMLGFSAAYNTWPVSRIKWLLRRFDHSAIYVMIAGTYTPFVAQIKNDLVSMRLLIGIWLAAAIGVALKLLLPGRFDNLAIVICLLLGWSGVVVYPSIFAVLPGPSTWLLAAGGVLYTLGVVFHVWERLWFQNVIWHVFVLVAACCHFSAVTILYVSG